MLSWAGRGGSRRRWAKDNSNNDGGSPSVNTSQADWTDVCLFTTFAGHNTHTHACVCQEECCCASAEQTENKYIRKSGYASEFRSVIVSSCWFACFRHLGLDVLERPRVRQNGEILICLWTPEPWVSSWISSGKSAPDPLICHVSPKFRLSPRFYLFAGWD